MSQTDPRPAVLKIRDRLLSHGWRQHAVGREAGPNCLIGATQLTIQASKIRYIDLLYELKEIFGTQYLGPFNDRPSTTRADIIGILDQYLCEVPT